MLFKVQKKSDGEAANGPLEVLSSRGHADLIGELLGEI